MLQTGDLFLNSFLRGNVRLNLQITPDAQSSADSFPVQLRH